MNSRAARERASLETLLKHARRDADALRIDLRDLERARAGAERSLDELEAEIRKEAVSGGADYAAYAAAARERRFRLSVTLNSLEAMETDLRGRIERAAVEMKKFEHLIARADEARLARTRRRERAATDEIAQRLRA